MLPLGRGHQTAAPGVFLRVISSWMSAPPGGRSMRWIIALRPWTTLRARGVRFTTRALMSVSSAAANLVSLGDHRIASRGATFLYHQARAGGMDAVTVQSARQILNAVDKIDERYLNRLVGPSAPRRVSSHDAASP